MRITFLFAKHNPRVDRIPPELCGYNTETCTGFCWTTPQVLGQSFLLAGFSGALADATC